MYEATKLYSAAVSWSSACEDLMYTAPFQLLQESAATSVLTCCLPHSVVASWMSENTGLSSLSPFPAFHVWSFACCCVIQLYGSCSRMNEPRRKLGVRMLDTGAMSESSRSQTMTSFLLPAANARMRLPRPFTAWMTRNADGFWNSAFLNISGVMT